jgi:hypothetical protein
MNTNSLLVCLIRNILTNYHNSIRIIISIKFNYITRKDLLIGNEKCLLFTEKKKIS